MRSRTTGSVTVEQLVVLGAVGLGVLVVFASLGGALEAVMVGSGASGAPAIAVVGGSGSGGGFGTAGGTASTGSGDSAIGSVDPVFGGGLGGDEPFVDTGGRGGDEETGESTSGETSPLFGGGGLGGDEPDTEGATAAVWLREQLERWSREHDDTNIDESTLEEMARSDDPDFAQAGRALQESPTLFHALDTGQGDGDVDGTISLEDLEDARYDVAALGAFGADAGMPEDRDEAEDVLERYEFLADTAGGRGGRDGDIGIEDLRAILEDPSLEVVAPGLREAAAYMLEHHASDYEGDDCSGISFCQIGEAYDVTGLDSLVDFVWDDLGTDSLLSNLGEGLFWRTWDNLQNGAGAWYEWPVDLFADTFTAPLQVSGNGLDQLRSLLIWGTQSVNYDEPDHWGLPFDGRQPLSLYGDAGPTLDDVEQQDLGDCVPMAGIAAILVQNPDVIRDAIRDNGDGTYTVTFHEQRSPGYVWDREWRTHEVTVTAEVPLDDDGNPLYADVNDGVLWPAILESAWAQYRGGYHRIDGDNGSGLLEALTGHTGSFSYALFDEVAQVLPGSNPRVPSFERLVALHEGGYAIIAGAGRNPGPRVVGSHMQYVLDVDAEAGTVTIGNPWGTDTTPRVFTYDEFANGFSMVSSVSTEPLEDE
jgi:hypothetical protein